MAFNLIRRILKIGLQQTVPILEYRKILITNYLTFFCIGGAVCMGVVSMATTFLSQAYICFTSAAFYLLVFYLNRDRKYRAAGAYFLTLSILTVIALAYASITEGMETGVENVLLVLIGVPLLILDGKWKNITYWIVLLVLVGIKMAQYRYIGQAFDSRFLINLLYVVFAAWFLYVVLSFFKRLLSRAVEKTNEHEKTLYSLLDNVPVFMALVDKDGTYRIANENYAELFGVDKSDIIGKKRSKTLPQNILDNHEPYFRMALEGEPSSFLEKNVMPRGDHMYSKGKYVPIKNEQGEVESISIYVDDVSELVEAEESLRRANATKDKLFSIIAHDIRSPLNLFQSILNVSSDRIISKEEFLVYQDELKGRLQSLRERLDELLHWARMQMGGINAYPSEVDVNVVVKENADLYKTLITRKNIEFLMDLKSEVDGWIDENHLQVAIRNIVHNALKFTEEGGSIHVSTSQDDESVLIEIVDTGAGMSPEIVDSIVKKEIQKSEVGTSGEKGTGLGLSLSLGLLEKNHCIVSLESEPGKGSIFRIWIPKSDINDPVTSN